MQDNQEKLSVTIRLEESLIRSIDELRGGTERNRTQQIAFMLKGYLKMNEITKQKKEKLHGSQRNFRILNRNTNTSHTNTGHQAFCQAGKKKMVETGKNETRKKLQQKTRRKRGERKVKERLTFDK